MAESLGDALLELRTDDRQLRSGFRDAEKLTVVAASRMEKVFAVILTGAVVAGILRSFDKVINRLDLIAKQSDKLGLTVEALQEMRFAAELSGVAITTFDMGFQRFVRRAGEAAKGAGEAKVALRELGFTLDDLETKSPEELFTQALEALAGIDDAAQRLRLAFKLFDSEGVAIVNMADDFARLRQEARDLGIVLSDDLVRDAVKMKDELTRVIAALDSVWARFVINFGRGLDVLFNLIPDTIEEQIGARVDELREVQNQLAAMASPMFGSLNQQNIERLNERQEILQQEIRTLVELDEARRRAMSFQGDPLVPAGPDAAAKRAKFVRELLDGLEDEIGLLDARAAVIGLNADEAVTFLARQAAEIALRRANIDLLPDEIAMLEIWTSDLGDAALRLEELAEAHHEAEEAARDQEREIRRIADAFAAAVLEVRSLEDALGALQRILLDVLSRRATSFLSGLFDVALTAGASFLGGLFPGPATAAAGTSVTGTSPVPSFAHGGSFTVGGRGGVDRNLVQFRATRGERVDITPAGRAGGGGVTVNIINKAQVEVTQGPSTTGPDGEQALNFFIDKAVAGNLRPGTATFRAMGAVFGSRQQLIAR